MIHKWKNILKKESAETIAVNKEGLREIKCAFKQTKHLFKQRNFWRIQTMNFWNISTTFIKFFAGGIIFWALFGYFVASAFPKEMTGEQQLLMDTVFLTLFWIGCFADIFVPLLEAMFKKQFSRLLRPKMILYLALSIPALLGPTYVVRHLYYPPFSLALSFTILYFVFEINKKFAYRRLWSEITNKEKFIHWIPFISQYIVHDTKNQSSCSFYTTSSEVERKKYSGFITRETTSVEIKLKYSAITLGCSTNLLNSLTREGKELHDLDFKEWPLYEAFLGSSAPINPKE